MIQFITDIFHTFFNNSFDFVHYVKYNKIFGIVIKSKHYFMFAHCRRFKNQLILFFIFFILTDFYNCFLSFILHFIKSIRRNHRNTFRSFYRYPCHFPDNIKRCIFYLWMPPFESFFIKIFFPLICTHDILPVFLFSCF